MTKIINIKSGEPYDLYIGRANKTYNVEESIWANPFIIGKHGNRSEVIEKYRLWINSQPQLLNKLNELKDKSLACWCNFPDENCHGSILIELSNSKYIKNWFSNMLPFEKPLIYQNIEYKTPENFYQAMKLPKYSLLRKKISEMEPHYAKTSIRNKDRFKWDENWNKDKAIKVMEYALKWKFQKGTDWNRKLMITKDLDLELVEWNNWNDIYWGKSLKTLNGENNLGRILMKIRDNC